MLARSLQCVLAYWFTTSKQSGPCPRHPASPAARRGSRAVTGVRVHWYTMSKQSGRSLQCVLAYWFTTSKQSGPSSVYWYTSCLYANSQGPAPDALQQ
jgi:hypothetical protein